MHPPRVHLVYGDCESLHLLHELLHRALHLLPQCQTCSTWYTSVCHVSDLQYMVHFCMSCVRPAVHGTLLYVMCQTCSTWYTSVCHVSDLQHMVHFMSCFLPTMHSFRSVRPTAHGTLLYVMCLTNNAQLPQCQTCSTWYTSVCHVSYQQCTASQLSITIIYNSTWSTLIQWIRVMISLRISR